LWPAQANSSRETILKIPNTKEGWGSGSGGRDPELFKPQNHHHHQKNKQTKKTKKTPQFTLPISLFFLNLAMCII
jgi:hypothetical protein